MATNKSVLDLLERTTELIDELNAIKTVLRHHIAAQRRQGPNDWKDTYRYDAKRKRYDRVRAAPNA